MAFKIKTIAKTIWPCKFYNWKQIHTITLWIGSAVYFFGIQFFPSFFNNICQKCLKQKYNVLNTKQNLHDMLLLNALFKKQTKMLIINIDQILKGEGVSVRQKGEKFQGLFLDHVSVPRWCIRQYCCCHHQWHSVTQSEN